MSWFRTNSSPEVTSLADVERPVDTSSSSLEGVGANVKLLLKLIQDHNEASTKDNDGRKMQRVAGMVSILDDVKARVEKSQSFPGRKKRAELRRCNTDLRINPVPRDKKSQEPVCDDNQKLRGDLTSSMIAQKSLERMFSSLGKEKEIMAAELARKVHELHAIEEHVNDLKEQNEKLLAKVQVCATEHKEKKEGAEEGDVKGSVALQERNKSLSDQLLKYLDGYRSLKRKLKEAQQENAEIRAKMAEMSEEVAAGLNRIHDIRQRVAESNEQPVEIQEELSALEQIFRCVEMKDSKNGPKVSENVEKTPILT